MRDFPLVSIVISCYNQEDYIGDAIDSVFNQTYPNIEVIISDDGSTDNSREIILDRVNNWEHKDRVKLFLCEHNTTFACVEEAYHSACGKYISGIGGDDMIKPDKTAKQVEFLEDNQGKYKLCFTWIECVGCDMEEINLRQGCFNIPNMTHPDMFKTLFLRGNCLAAPSMMMQKDLYEELGGYNFSLRQTQDYVLWLKSIIKNDIYILPEKLTQYRIVQGSLSDAKSDPKAEIRALEELVNEMYEAVLGIENDDFERLFTCDENGTITREDLKCKKTMLFYEYALKEMDVRAGEIATRLYFHYLNDDGFAKKLKDRYGIDRKTMYQFVSNYTLGTYALQANEMLKRYQEANEKHRLDISNIHKSDIEMVNELLDVLDDKRDISVTGDHIIALYDFCINNGNKMDDFENMIHALNEKTCLGKTR